MKIISYESLGRRLIAVFALLVCSPVVFHPTPQTTASCVEPFVNVGQPLPDSVAPTWSFPARQSDNLIVSYTQNTGQVPIPPFPIFGGSESGKIAKDGPTFAAMISMSSFTLKGFVKSDGWMILVDYELEPESTAVIAITTKDTKQPFVLQLPSTNDQRQEVIRELSGFGKKLQVGELTFQAFKNGPDPRKPARFFLYGLALGDRKDVIGSMVVDQLHFQPGTLRPNLKEKATYSFRSLSDFDRASADFLLVTLSDGILCPQLAARQMFKNGVRRGESVTKDWDGKNTKGKVSRGPYQFRVRVWRGLKSGGDWVFASTKQEVRVQ